MATPHAIRDHNIFTNRTPGLKGEPLVAPVQATCGQYESMSPRLTLPTLVDVDKIEAKYDHGVLRLTLPKHAAAKPRKIAVKPS